MEQMNGFLGDWIMVNGHPDFSLPVATRTYRLRLLNGIAVAVEEIWLDGRVGTLKTVDLSDSLYQTYRSKLGFWITRASGRAPKSGS